MAGIPPLAGFFSKYYIMAAALSKGLFILVIVALAVSLISAYYYLRIIKTFWFEEQTAEKQVTATLTPLRRRLLSVIEALLWTFAISAAPLLSAIDTVTFALTQCG